MGEKTRAALVIAVTVSLGLVVLAMGGYLVALWVTVAIVGAVLKRGN